MASISKALAFRAAFVWALLFGTASLADEQPEASPVVTRIAEGVPGPLLVAARPGDTPLVCLCEPATGRLFAIEEPTGDDETASDEPTDQAAGSDAAGSDAAAGLPLVEMKSVTGGKPTTMAFLDRRTLLIGVGGPTVKERRVQVFRVSDRRGTRAPSVAKRRSARELLPDAVADLTGECIGLAANERYVFSAVGTPGEPGRILRARHTASMLSGFRPLVSIDPTAFSGSPCCVAYNNGGFVSTLIEASDGSGSLLVYGQPDMPSGSKASPWSVRVPITGVVAMAYSPMPRPAEQLLYALVKGDEPTEGGLYRIDAAVLEDGSIGARANKLIDLENPVSMSFDSAGVLFITTAGAQPETADVFKIVGEL